ncbi:TetR/AcrR family transcriptional regulator [Pseudactinotalea suaedae]|uniref:TetR/AcrR family transcriptional regulator n=1 Tax=Pseudactinotalea suaedae TaxID=1524924 RepID=UPI0012E1F293|nr:TetR/AcrR family transcriptional regulator [Pseudactinotalea suaedae]
MADPADAPPDAPPRRDRRLVRGEIRRDKILAIAVEVFGTQGFRGGSLREIAQRVGISEAGLLHHFGSKAGLLAAVLAERDRIDAERRVEAEAAGTSLVDGMRALVRRNAATPGLVGLHVIVSAEATEPGHPAHELYRERYRGLRAQDREGFRALVEKGLLRQDIDPDKIGLICSAVMDGLQLQWLLDPENVDLPDLFDHFLSLLEGGAAPVAAGDTDARGATDPS